MADDGTLYVRARAGLGDVMSRLYVWTPAANNPVKYPFEIVGPILSKVALHRPTGTLYANGFVDQQSGNQTVHRCACDTCSAASISCGVIGDVDVDPSRGRT